MRDGSKKSRYIPDARGYNAHDRRGLSYINNEVDAELYFRWLRNTMLKNSANRGCRVLILRIKLVDASANNIRDWHIKSAGHDPW